MFESVCSWGGGAAEQPDKISSQDLKCQFCAWKRGEKESFKNHCSFSVITHSSSHASQIHFALLKLSDMKFVFQVIITERTASPCGRLRVK